MTSQPLGHDESTGDGLKVALFGRCLLRNGLEIPCQAVQISNRRVLVFSANMPASGDRVIAYFDHVGRIEGATRSYEQNSFWIEIEASERRREKISELIDWLQHHPEFGNAGNRRAERFVPANKNSAIKLDDGRSYPVELIDISLSGAAFKSPIKPALGSIVHLAGMKGTVRRHFDEGAAIEFDTSATRSGLFRTDAGHNAAKAANSAAEQIDSTQAKVADVIFKSA